MEGCANLVYRDGLEGLRVCRGFSRRTEVLRQLILNSVLGYLEPHAYKFQTSQPKDWGLLIFSAPMVIFSTPILPEVIF